MAVDKKEAKLKAKRESLKTLGTGFGRDEPVIDEKNYTASLMRALNYYNASYDNKDKRKWFMNYVGKKEAANFEGIQSDFEFRSAGTLARLKMREQPLKEQELQTLDEEVKRLKSYVKVNSSLKVVKVEEEKQEDKPKVSIQDRMAEAASQHIAEINALFDDFIVKDERPNFAAYLKSNNVSGQVSKLIPPAFVKLWNELNEVVEGEDKQLVEGWSNLKKTKIKQVLKLIEELETACAQQAVAAKSARKPRARKEKPASVLAAKMKYMKEYTELGLTSEKPEKIVGANEVMVYNTKYKKVQIYRAFGDGALSVKGTTIIGYDVATSGGKTLRKPEQMKDFVTMTKRSFGAAFKALKTKESAVNGRINEDCIIAKVY